MTPRRVLIVEDEMIVQMHLKRIIDRIGHRVTGTATGLRDAIAAADRETPDLVLMDIGLSDGEDGVEAAQLLCDRYGCAAVFVTAYADSETLARTEAVGAAGYIVKPFADGEVRAAVGTALASHARLERLRERARSLTSILGSMGEAILVVDDTSTVSFMNPQAVALTGWPADEAYDRHIFDILRFSADRDARAMRETLARSLARTQRASLSQLDIVARDGGERAVNAEIEPITEDGREIGGLIVTLRDRTPYRERSAPVSPTSYQPFGPGTRLLVYSHDTFGLGHLQRNLNLIRMLVARHPGLSVLLVTGSPVVHRYELPKGTDYMKLPAVRKVARERYEPRSLKISDSGIHGLRRNLLLRTVRDYDPNVLLVDHSPTGMKGELLPALDWLQQRGSCARILGLRDIIDDPRSVTELWDRKGIYGIVRHLYDHVVVYGSRGVYDPVKLYRFPADVAVKTHFLNYVCETTGPEDEAPGVEEGSLPLVVVSIGGGDGGGQVVIGSFLDMLQRFASEIGFRARILTGPFLPVDLEKRFREKARDLPVSIEEFIPSTTRLFQSAELVVATAGYNTTTQLLAHARRAILIPRILHRDEQLIRARRMHELGLMTCLHPDEVTPVRLWEAVQRSLNADEALTRGRARGAVPLDGAERLSEFCSTLRVASAPSAEG